LDGKLLNKHFNNRNIPEFKKVSMNNE